MRRRCFRVGARPVGIGCFLYLQRARVDFFVLLEAQTIGASFLRWPVQIRLKIPSFHLNPYHQTDWNVVNPDTSLGIFSGKIVESLMKVTFIKEWIKKEDYY